MTIHIENSDRQINLALKSASIEEIDEIINRLVEYKEQLLMLGSNKDQLKKLIDEHNGLGGNVRVSFKRTAYKRPPKYQFTDDGENKTWAGVGKMPKALRALTTVNGKVSERKLKQFLIVKDDKAVYQYKDNEGFIRTWSGKGQCPAGLQMLLDKGYPLENFRIKAH